MWFASDTFFKCTFYQRVRPFSSPVSLLHLAESFIVRCPLGNDTPLPADTRVGLYFKPNVPPKYGFSRY